MSVPFAWYPCGYGFPPVAGRTPPPKDASCKRDFAGETKEHGIWVIIHAGPTKSGPSYMGRRGGHVTSRPSREEETDRVSGVDGVFIGIWNGPGRHFPEHRI